MTGSVTNLGPIAQSLMPPATPPAVPVSIVPIIDDAFEEKVLACMYRINDFAAVAAQHVKASYFGNPMRRNLAKMANEFWLSYGAVIKDASLVHEIKALVDLKVIRADEARDYGNYILRLNKIDISDYKWVLYKLVQFVKHRELKAVINDAVAKHMPKGEFDKIEKALLEALAITSRPDPTVYKYMDTNNVDSRAVRRERASKTAALGIPTGIPEMDRTLSKGGWYRKELYVIMAPTKTGKTFSLLWFANFAAQQGFNVLFFTLETSTEVLTDRMDAMNTQIETNMLKGSANHVATILKSKHWSGDVFFLEYPTKTCTVGEIERRIEKFERESGISVDMVVVDYGDLLKAKYRMDNKLDEQAGIFEDLRGVAGKYGLPVLTATQVNRTGTGKAVNDGTDVSGTFEKIMIADEVIALSAKKDELREGKLRISFAESRNSAGKTFMIKTNYAAGTFYKEFVAVE